MEMHISIFKYVFGDKITMLPKQAYLLIYQTLPWLKDHHHNQHRHHRMYHLARRDVQAPHVVGE